MNNGRRAIDYRATTGKLVYCNALVVCPGCLGYALIGMMSVFCAVHQGLTLDAFPVYQSSHAPSCDGSSSYEQPSLW